MTRTAIVLGTQSFVDRGCRVGSQYLAAALSEFGWEVDYVATSSSPFDVWGRKRHARFMRAWTSIRHDTGVPVTQRLTEWTFKAPFPAHKLFLKWRWQIPIFSCFIPKEIKQKQYDLCLTEVTTNLMYLPQITARKRILRLNDWPPGFAHDLSPSLINELERGIKEGAYDDVWAVSRPLASYATRLNAKNRTLLLPNGVADFSFVEPSATPRTRNTAIYIGELGAWFDLELLVQTARLLPEWNFDIYGPGSESLSGLPSNIRGFGSVSRERVPALLASYEVGLIPFRDADGRMSYVERPLKFFEYLSSGLGVASTDYGALRDGMGDLAQYGSTPEAFANAIKSAQSAAKTRSPCFAREFADEHSWAKVANKVHNRLEVVLNE